MTAKHAYVVVGADLRLDTSSIAAEDLKGIRRRLRRSFARYVLASRHPARRAILRTSEGQLIVPRTYLHQLTAAVHSQGLELTLTDQRVSIPAAPLELHSPTLSDQAKGAVARVLRHECGVIFTQAPLDREQVLLKLLSYWRQTTLILHPTPAHSNWPAAWAKSAPSSPATPRLMSYRKVHAELTAGHSLPDCGLVVLDDLGAVSWPLILDILQNSASRYVIGFANASEPETVDIQASQLILGGVTCRVGDLPTSATTPRVGLRSRATHFQNSPETEASFQEIVTSLTGDSQRNAQILKDVQEELSTSRKCLVLSERRQHLNALSEGLGSSFASQSWLLTSGMKHAQRNQVVAQFVRASTGLLLTTLQILGDRALPTCQSVFLVYPFSYTRPLERLLSTMIGTNSHGALLIFDYDDLLVPTLHRSFGRRRRALERFRARSAEIHARQAQLDLPL